MPGVKQKGKPAALGPMFDAQPYNILRYHQSTSRILHALAAAGAKKDGKKVEEVKGRKKQARAWIGDWQKRTKKQ